MVKVIYEDSWILVLDKPPGLVVTSSETQKTDTLEDFLKRDWRIKADRSGIVHRLDKDTSGVIIVAKTDEIKLELQAQFKSREVSKEYIALVHGILEKSGKVDAAIGRNPGNREKFVVFPNAIEKNDEEEDEDGVRGKNAITEYEPIQALRMTDQTLQALFSGFNKIQFRKLTSTNYSLFTLLRCHPLTGRTHQIRVHLKYIGFPIVGDEKYGGRKTVRLDHRWISRQFLHAAKLKIKHPSTGKDMVFHAPLPEDLNKALGLLEQLK